MGHYQTGRYLPNLRGVANGVAAISGSGRVESPTGLFTYTGLGGNPAFYMAGTSTLTLSSFGIAYLKRNTTNQYIPAIYSGAGAPGSTPVQIGDIYCDTTGGKVYIATATTGADDWKLLN